MKISIVVPVFNEKDNIPLLYQATIKALENHPATWEMVLVDDGSTDNSAEILEDLAQTDPEHIRVVILRRNFGQTAAIAAGIDHSCGEIIIPMDADMQNDPIDIPVLMEKIDEGYDVVSGWRIHRQDTFLTRKIPSFLANRLISWVSGVWLHDYGCTMKAYRREVITGFRLYGEMHRFIPVYAHSFGAKITEVKVHHHARKFGKAKYGLERTLKVVLDLIVVKFLSSFGSKPIYLFGAPGFVMIFASALVLLYLFIRRMWFGISVLASPLFMVSTMFIIMGFQSILMGLIAELQVRTYYESQDKPTYTVRKGINIHANPDSDL